MSEPVVHVVDDDAAMRDSLSFLLEAAGMQARTYDSALALLDRMDVLEPGCILTDVRMPEMSGLDLVRRLKALNVAMPIVIMTGHADVPLAIEAMKAGVVDFLEKPFDDEALLSALRAALAQGQEARAEAQEQAAIRARIDSLSPRERDVLDGLVAGRANKVIAFDLGISPRTVEIYRANLMTKMQAGSLSELVRMALLVGRT
ncbi:MAG TPA: response regulator FixJ [Reyranella sp.]|nr:response regulator FixJ [Reyranella sp.]